MYERLKLFFQRNPYDLSKSNVVFLKLIRDAIRFHHDHCPAYREMLTAQGFDPESLVVEEDLSKSP